MPAHRRPQINATSFGSITIDGESYEHDIVITLQGEVKKRKKKLSKAIYGSSHTISLPEIEYIYQEAASGILIGSGQYGVTRLSKKASDFLEAKNCPVELMDTPRALKEWNRQTKNWIGLFHITC